MSLDGLNMCCLHIVTYIVHVYKCLFPLHLLSCICCCMAKQKLVLVERKFHEPQERLNITYFRVLVDCLVNPIAYVP